MGKPLKQFVAEQMGKPLLPHHRRLVDLIEGVEAGRLVIRPMHIRPPGKSILLERKRKLRGE